MRIHSLRIVMAITVMAVLTACGSDVKDTETSDAAYSNPLDIVKDKVEDAFTEETIYPCENLSEYIGVSYISDNPFTCYLNNERIITDKNGNIMVREEYVTDRDPFPENSDFHGECRIGWNGDTSILINKSGEVVYTNPVEKYSIFSHEFSNGRSVFECTSGHNDWLVDEKGNEITNPADSLLYCTEDFYRVRTADGENILYDCDDNIVYQGGKNVQIGVPEWSSTGDRYLYVMDGSNYSSGSRGDVTIYQMPDMNVVFSEENVVNVGEFGEGVAYAFAPDILSRQARVIVIYKGRITLDTIMEYDQRISVRGKYEQNRVYIDHDGDGWVYTTYELDNGRFISENLQRSPEGERDDEMFDRTRTASEKNFAIAEKLGVDLIAHDYATDYSYQMNLRADLFQFLEKETGRRLFCNFLGNGQIELIDDNTGKVLLSGEELYGPIPDHYENIDTVFAYATNGDGVGKLVNLASGKSLNVSGEFIGFQKIYAIFKESDDTYRIINFDMDSFTVDANGNISSGDDYRQLKNNEPEYESSLVIKNVEAEDEELEKVIEQLKKYAATQLVLKMGASNEEAKEMVDYYLTYQIIRGIDTDNGENIYLADIYIERTLSETVIVTLSGNVFDNINYKYVFDGYRNGFSFDITNFDEYYKMMDDPTYVAGGDGFDVDTSVEPDEGNALSKWSGVYELEEDPNYRIEVMNTFTDGTIYFNMDVMDAEGIGVISNEYNVSFSNDEMTEFTIPYQNEVNEVFRLVDGGIEVSLDNGMRGANDGFYKKVMSY